QLAPRRCKWPASKAISPLASASTVSISSGVMGAVAKISPGSVLPLHGVLQDAGLPQAFLPFLSWVGVVHDASAHTVDPVAAFIQHQRTYRHVQRKIAIRRQPPDCAAIQPARG